MRIDATFPRLVQARDLLREVGDEPLTIEAVARTVAISRTHFIRQFDAAFGQTPHQFRLDARMERARQLLHAGRHSVTDVCFALGFSSLGSFSSLFSRRVGVSPSAYRRQVRGWIAVTGGVAAAPPHSCLGLMACVPAHIALFEKRSRLAPRQTGS